MTWCDAQGGAFDVAAAMPGRQQDFMADRTNEFAEEKCRMIKVKPKTAPVKRHQSARLGRTRRALPSIKRAIPVMRLFVFCVCIFIALLLSVSLQDGIVKTILLIGLRLTWLCSASLLVFFVWINLIGSK
jgi:hypothetical protein